MARKCSICESEHLKAIDKSLVDNDSIRAIAERYGMTIGSVHRHKTNHLPVAMIKARQAEEVIHGSALMNRVEKIMARCERISEITTAEGDWTPALGALRELRGCIELLGKLSGEINSAPKIAVQVNTGGESLDVRELSDAELEARIAARLGVAQGVSEERQPVTIDAKLLTS